MTGGSLALHSSIAALQEPRRGARVDVYDHIPRRSDQCVVELAAMGDFSGTLGHKR